MAFNPQTRLNPITLTWLNSLGGWEYWVFPARHTYGYDISEVERLERDIFKDWDNEFINGQTETETLSLKVSPTILVRSQGLTREEANAVAQIRTAIKVQDAAEGVTVQIDRGSFTYRTDREKNIELEFRIIYPREQTQIG